MLQELAHFLGGVLIVAFGVIPWVYAALVSFGLPRPAQIRKMVETYVDTVSAMCKWIWKQIKRLFLKRKKRMKEVTIYTDGGYCFANPGDVPTRSPLARQPLGDDSRPRRREVL